MLTSCKPMRSEYRWEAPIRGFEKPSRNPSRSERHRGTAIWRHSPVLPGAKRRIERELKDAELQFFLCAVMTLFFVVSEKLMLVVQMELVLYLLEKSKEKCTSRHPASTGSPRVIRARSALKALVNISPPRASYRATAITRRGLEQAGGDSFCRERAAHSTRALIWLATAAAPKRLVKPLSRVPLDRPRRRQFVRRGAEALPPTATSSVATDGDSGARM